MGSHACTVGILQTKLLLSHRNSKTWRQSKRLRHEEPNETILPDTAQPYKFDTIAIICTCYTFQSTWSLFMAETLKTVRRKASPCLHQRLPNDGVFPTLGAKVSKTVPSWPRVMSYRSKLSLALQSQVAGGTVWRPATISPSWHCPTPGLGVWDIPAMA